MGGDHGGAHVAVAQEFLCRADVSAGLQQMGGEGVAQGMDRETGFSMSAIATVSSMRVAVAAHKDGGASRRRFVDRPRGWARGQPNATATTGRRADTSPRAREAGIRVHRHFYVMPQYERYWRPTANESTIRLCKSLLAPS